MPKLKKSRLRGNLIALYSFLMKGGREGGAELFWDPVTRCVAVIQSWVRMCLDWILGSISLPRGWSDTGTGFLDRWSMPQACQCFKRHWDKAPNNMLLTFEEPWIGLTDELR